MTENWTPPPALAEFVRLDHDRAARRGYAEAVLCDSKTVEQVVVIAAQVLDREARTLFTRVRTDQVEPLLAALPGAAFEADARIVAFPGEAPAPTGSLVVVLAAGTSDLPVAAEAAVTARHLGRPTGLVVDVGVAGLH